MHCVCTVLAAKKLHYNLRPNLLGPVPLDGDCVFHAMGSYKSSKRTSNATSQLEKKVIKLAG